MIILITFSLGNDDIDSLYNQGIGTPSLMYHSRAASEEGKIQIRKWSLKKLSRLPLLNKANTN
jgi:hypothetical protein